jgi:hypothetical protein
MFEDVIEGLSDEEEDMSEEQILSIESPHAGG